jgi:ABC-type Fe3+ transport system substrate-binding protein/predicted Ser/Thr protein kinase
MGQTRGSIPCGHCGTLNEASEQFCANCGYSLAGPPTSPSLVVTQPPASGRRITGALAAGTLLGGRYQVVALVGKGGFGAVYKALDQRFSGRRAVAIKEMGDAMLSPSEKARALQDFRQEADLLVQLSHPNLPNVSDFFEEAGKAYLVMEFIEGKTLAKVLEEAGGPLDEELVMDWALDLCAVLHYLHTRPQPIIFRDMKPANIMLTPEEELKLIDFGIARIFKSQVTRDTTLLGSQGYAPLEQYGRGQSDARSDIYALGATLYELLTNELPLDAPTRRINPQLFRLPRQINPRISPATEAIILKAMAEEPPLRYQTAADMYQAIVDRNTSSSTAAAGQRTVVGASSGTGSQAGSTLGTLGAGAAQIVAPAAGAARGSIAPPSGRRISRRALIAAGATAAIAAAGIASVPLFFFRRTPSPAGGLSFSFVYSTEKEAWMSAAIRAFNEAKITLNGRLLTMENAEDRGSGDARIRILSGQLRPVAWSPASTLELNQLIDDWKQAHNGAEIVASSGDLEPRSLVFSPLVFAVWEERAQLLLRRYGSIDWPAIHSAVTLKNGWQDLGGPSAWGQVKLAQTRPDQSNSGLLTIALMAYNYFKLQRGLTVANVQDQGFLSYLGDFEKAIYQFGRSSGTYLQYEVIPKGPAAYDLVFTYENLVLTLQQEAQQRQGMALVPFYPGLNLISDHPFVIFNASWVSPEQQQAARIFRDFLLAEEQQRAALKSGFRPVGAVKINDPVAGNPFLHQPPAIKISPQIGPEAQPPAGTVVDALLQEWISAYGNSPTAPS